MIDVSFRAFFIQITYPVRPYFYIGVADNLELQASSYLSKKYPFVQTEIVDKEDLDLVSIFLSESFILQASSLQKNHLSGLKGRYLKLTFPSLAEHAKVKKDLMVNVRKNSEKRKQVRFCSLVTPHCHSQDEGFANLLAKQLGGLVDEGHNDDVLDKLMEIR